MATPFIHTFTTPGGYYFYDVNKNMILKVQRNVYDKLDKLCKAVGDLGLIEYDNDIIELMERGFLSNNRTKKLVHPSDEILEYSLSRKLSMILLQVTQQCNLRCRYCVYSGNYENRAHTNKKMSFDTAKKGIDFLLEHSCDNENAYIGFYGGEPLLEFELIKNIVNYAENRFDGKSIQFNLTTNATLLSKEIVDYFEEHNFSTLISLDGPSEIHDKNRTFAGSRLGSFEKIMENLENIKESNPEYFKKIAFNAVLDMENDFGCVNKFFTDYDTIKDSFISISDINPNNIKNPIPVTENYINKYLYEYFKLFLSKLKRLDEKYVSKLIRQHYVDTRHTYENLTPSEKLAEITHPSGPCIPGVVRLFMNTDGQFYPCERVSESSEAMIIGHIDSGFKINKIRELLNIGRLSEEKCKNCWAFRFCTICAQDADSTHELSSQMKNNHCQAVKESIQGVFKDICTLKEMGIDFEKEVI